jgi:large repetitive protein
VPAAPLTANTSYFLNLTSNIRDLDGTAQTFLFQRFLTTGTTTDNTAPQVLSVTPPDGAIAVGVNANIRVRFDEAINPLSVSGSTILVTDGIHTSMPSTISFSNNNQEVLIVPHAPLPAATLLTLKIEGVEDLAGNLVASQTTKFTTGSGPDLTRAQVVRSNPFLSAINVPVNTVITVEVNEPIDAGTVTNNTFIVRDNTTGQNVVGTLSVSAGGRVITFMPNAPLAVSRSYSVLFSFNGILDLAGNFLEGSNFSFTTSFAADANGPQVLAVTPANGLTAVPTNAAVAIQFDEPIQSLSVDQVTLSTGGVNLNVNRILSNGNQTLTLKPLSLLAGLTTYNLSISAVKDLSDNVLAAPVNSSFTTATGVDLINPTVTQADPVNGATGVATNAIVRLQFSERINPLSVTESTFFVSQANTGIRVNGSITVAADGRSVTFTPSDPLLVNTRYFVQVSSITDLAGHPISLFIVFTTGAQ